MPFHGVLPERKYLFTPEPVSDIAVNDVNAWRLNPQYRHVYNKLHIALSQGLTAAPCGVSPLSLGLPSEQACFIKPIINLRGMSLNTSVATAQQLADANTLSANSSQNVCNAGSFWCEFLNGQQSSTDVLVHQGEPVWFAHTLAATEKHRNRPLYWEIGADGSHLEPVIAHFIRRELVGYTGLCNLELIGNHIIETHLRGSNAFFDYYCPGFIAAWVRLVDQQVWSGLDTIEKGCLYSMFGDWPLSKNAETIAEEAGVRLYRDGLIEDRVGILFADDPETARNVEIKLRASNQNITNPQQH